MHPRTLIGSTALAAMLVLGTMGVSNAGGPRALRPQGRDHHGGHHHRARPGQPGTPEVPAVPDVPLSRLSPRCTRPSPRRRSRANFSPNDNKGPLHRTPSFPSDARGTWHVHPVTVPQWTRSGPSDRWRQLAVLHQPGTGVPAST